MAGVGKSKTKLDPINHKTKIQLQIEADKTPIYQKQDFPYPKEMNSMDERNVWDWLVNIFRQTSNCRASDADINLMLLYCRAKVDYEKSDEEIRKLKTEDFYIRYDTGRSTPDGDTIYQIKKNPLYEIRKESYSVIIKIGDQLGLSPLGRARQGLAAANASNPDDVLKDIQNRESDD